MKRSEKLEKRIKGAAYIGVVTREVWAKQKGRIVHQQ